MRTGRPPKWSKENLIAAVQEWSKDHKGRSPTMLEFSPSHAAVYLFGSWNAFLEAAGLPSRKAQGGVKNAIPMIEFD